MDDKVIKHLCYKCKRKFIMVEGFVVHAPFQFCDKCFKEVYPKTNTGIFLDNDELSKLSSLHFRCISPSYNFITLSEKSPQEEYDKFIKTVTGKYGVTEEHFEISKKGEFITQKLDYPNL